jgi:hypothetical protein
MLLLQEAREISIKNKPQNDVKLFLFTMRAKLKYFRLLGAALWKAFLLFVCCGCFYSLKKIFGYLISRPPTTKLLVISIVLFNITIQ